MQPFATESRLLKTLSHPERLAILAVLRKQEACACHVGAALRRPQAYVSQQLAILRKAGLIEQRRSGTFVYYRLHDHAVLGLVDLAVRVAGGPGAIVQDPDTCRCPRCVAGTTREAA